MKNAIYLVFIMLLAFSCSSKKNIVEKMSDDVQTMTEDEKLMAKANELAQKYIITDGHVDLPYRLKVKNFRLEKEYLGIPVETKEGDFDYVRAKKGGLDAPFMSIYIPSSYQKNGGAKMLADSLIDMIEWITIQHPDKFQLCHNAAQARKLFSRGVIALPLGMENGAGIEDSLKNVEYFKRRGVSYITLTHSTDNLICDSSYDTTGTHNGLSAYGRQVVAEMNKQGVMVDISHVSDSAFYQTIEITKAPVIASHSSARKYTPGFERNMNDDMIKVLGENGGVIQINFGSTFLDGKVADDRNKKRSMLMKLLNEKNLKYTDDAAKPIMDQFAKDHPSLFSDVEMVADHIDHVVSLAGVDHVGFGSDYDGVGDSLPTGLKDVSQYPNLIYELLKRGYTDEDIEKICYKNVFRVWEQVETIAAELN